MLDNAMTGFDMHTLGTGAYIRTLLTKPTERNFPRQVCFGENGGVVIGGSNDGSIYVFDHESGASLDILHHSKSARTQTVTVRLCRLQFCEFD